MIQRDIISVINRIVDSFSGKVLTKPSILRKMENKIYQLIYASKNGWELYQTNIFKRINEDIALTPIYLQYYIPKQFEVRLTIVGKTVYPVRIDTENQIDWRADYQNHKYKKIVCSDDIIMKCYKLMDDFNLTFGAFDFIVTPENKWIFFEVNPNG